LLNCSLPVLVNANSLRSNDIGDEGARDIAEALKSKPTLKKLSCVLSLLLFLSFEFLQAVCWACSIFSPTFYERAHSLAENGISADGARAVADALKNNATLKELVCVSFPSLLSRMPRAHTFLSLHFSFPLREREHRTAFTITTSATRVRAPSLRRSRATRR
jgi:hypothetical protein